ncbi:hypothetical protein, partial [Actinomadura sp. KC345]|uniref:hypothetical protein n=1 Tax=Actinomadura sp. KC345 TaxID=2530371 RepID=UPI001A9E51C1
MRYGVVRALAGGAMALGASGLLGGCGTLSSGPGPACTGTEKALRQYIAQVRAVSATPASDARRRPRQPIGRPGRSPP